MPVVRILYDVAGWAYHRRAIALQAHAPPSYTVEIGPLARGDDAGARSATRHPISYWPCPAGARRRCAPR
jgi:hypothetical protein